MGVLQLLLCTTILLNLKDEIDNVMKKRIMNTVPFHYLYICLSSYPRFASSLICFRASSAFSFLHLMGFLTRSLLLFTLLCNSK